jgi:hypothetical protein
MIQQKNINVNVFVWQIKIDVLLFFNVFFFI